MNDVPEGEQDALRSPVDRKLRSLVTVMRTGTPLQVLRAQEAFYDILHGQLFRARVARTVDPHRCEDIFQETMIAIWDGLPGFRGEASMVTWSHQIFRNKIADYLRSTGYNRTEPLDDKVESALVSDACDIAEALSRQQVRAFLAGCLATLRKKSHHRATAIEFVRLGNSMEEISASLEVPSGTIKRWLSEARQELVACIRRHGATGLEG